MARTVFAAGRKIRLDEIPTEPPDGITKEKARKRFEALGAELFELQDALWGAKVNSVMVVLQGRDSAGKDGAIKHVAGCLNPRGVSVVSFGVPTDGGARARLPVAGAPPRAAASASSRSSTARTTRTCSWCASTSLAPQRLWKERYGHIADFEELLAEHGTIVLKYFLHISKKEQKKRLLERESDPRPPGS